MGHDGRCRRAANLDTHHPSRHASLVGRRALDWFSRTRASVVAVRLAGSLNASVRRLGLRLQSTFSRPTVRLAAALVVLAVGVLVVLRWATDTNRFDAWVPEVVIGLATLAATITVVEWVIQREYRNQRKARAEAVMTRLCHEFITFGRQVAQSYRRLNPDPATHPVPAGVLDLIQLAIRHDGPPAGPYVDGRVPVTVFHGRSPSETA
jgi:hypothetical protein